MAGFTDSNVQSQPWVRGRGGTRCESCVRRASRWLRHHLSRQQQQQRLQEEEDGRAGDWEVDIDVCMEREGKWEGDSRVGRQGGVR